jgi:hypothetical protein
MTSSYGGPPAISDPAPYVRADGVNAIVYLGNDGQVREFSLQPGAWVNSNLNTSCGVAAPAPNSGADNAPNPYVRADRVSAVTYRSGSHLWELSLPFGATCWAKKNMTQEAGTTL